MAAVICHRLDNINTDPPASPFVPGSVALLQILFPASIIKAKAYFHESSSQLKFLMDNLSMTEDVFNNVLVGATQSS